MFVKDVYVMAGAGELLAAHSPRRTATNDRNVSHGWCLF
jgi:hypothetical protein